MWQVNPSYLELFFCLLSLRLSRFHDPGYEFGELTQVDLGYFICVLFLISFFFNFILQHYVNWELGSVICFIYLL